MPLLLLLLLEAGLRVAGFGYPTSFFLNAQLNGKPCLVENDQFGIRFFGPGMARTPYPVALPRIKAPGTTRVFVFGESAAYGDPQPEFGLPRMLEALLSLRFPERHFEVVNTGMTGINSHVVLPIARDCADEQGDFWVVYMGNNEVVGPFGSGTVFGPKALPRAFVRLSLAFKETRVGQLFDTIVRRLQKRSARESVWGGMAMFVKNHVRADDSRMATVYANFQGNLEDIISIGVRHGAKVVVSSMARNLRDCAPFASEHRSDLAASALSGWDQLYESGIGAARAGNSREAIDDFRQAAQIDASSADLHFRWGQCALAMTNRPEALREFTAACDDDALRFRSDTRINDIIKEVAASHQHEGVAWVDGQGVLAAASPSQIVGDELLYEHVHLKFEGNYLLARALAQQMMPTNTDWPSVSDCSRRLGFNDFFRREGERAVLQRFDDPPYTSQLNHAEEYQKAKAACEALLPATESAALEQDKLACRKAVAAWPDDWILRQNLALFEQRTGEDAASIGTLKRVTELLPQNHEAWRSLGVAYTRAKQGDNAAAAFSQALKFDPNDVTALDGLAELALASGKFDEARAEFEKLLKAQPLFGPAHLGLGKILDAAGRHEEAKAEYRKSMEVRVNTPASFIAMAKFFFGKGEYASAMTNFVDALRLNPADPEIHVNLGLTLAQLGRWDEAQAHYAEAVRLDPNFAEAHFCLGVAKGRGGDDTGASDEFADAVRLKPQLMEARLNFAIACYKQRRFAEAKEQFERALEQSPNNPTAVAYLQRLQQMDGGARQ